MKFGDKIYYKTEQDEILPFKNRKIKIDENYKYISKNPLSNLSSFLTYRFLATPYAFISFKILKNIKFHNTHLLKSHKKGGYFIYANHTNQFCDGFCPALICFPKKPYIIVDSSNISIPIIGRFNKMWGAIPLPDNIKATKNFYHAIENVLKNNNPVLIYPEAHLWPYYTKIRSFANSSFRYPVMFNKPVFTFTTVYTKKLNSKKPKIEIYVDGPFYPNTNLNEKEAQQELHDKVFETLNMRASLSNYEYVNYIKRSEND